MRLPEEANVDFLRDWLNGIGEGDSFLHDNECYTWNLPKNFPETEHRWLKRDLVTVHAAPEEQDIFSRILSASLLDLWTWLRSCRSPHRSYPNVAGQPATRFPKTFDPASGLLHYSESKLLKVNNIFISVVGAAMPIVAIVALYFIKTEGGRIGAMAGFTVAFALVLAICTNARRLEIAASTAA